MHTARVTIKVGKTTQEQLLRSTTGRGLLAKLDQHRSRGNLVEILETTEPPADALPQNRLLTAGNQSHTVDANGYSARLDSWVRVVEGRFVITAATQAA